MEDEFSKIGEQKKANNQIGDIFGLILNNKKWWMAPIIFILILIGLFVVLGGTGAAPFIYTFW